MEKFSLFDLSAHLTLQVTNISLKLLHARPVPARPGRDMHPDPRGRPAGREPDTTTALAGFGTRSKGLKKERLIIGSALKTRPQSYQKSETRDGADPSRCGACKERARGW